jgi:ApbE superfamily uncharacterized protein (UPF0280 family)
MERIKDNYRERTYRSNILKNNLTVFNVTVSQSDLFISSDLYLHDVALTYIQKYRVYVETYINAHPNFLTSLVPVQYDCFAPAIIREMMTVAVQSKVGPMAAVAGAIAEYVGRDLLNYSRNVIIENGGDIFISCQNDIRVGIFAGKSPLRDKITMIVREEEMPMGICTSSGTVGHSLSFGRADAVCVKAASASMADAAATSICNMVKSKSDVYRVLREGMKIADVHGIVVIIEDQIGVIGDVELVGE